MAGLYGLIRPEIKTLDHIPSLFAGSIPCNDIRELTNHNLIAGLQAEPSFRNERVLETREDITIGFYGFLFEPSVARADKLFGLYENGDPAFISQLDGYFNGFICDFRRRKLFLFTDHLSTRPLYVGIDPKSGTIAFSGDAHHAAGLLKASGLPLDLNWEALTCLLTIGYLFDDQTPVLQVRKIPFGTILELDLDNFHIRFKKYWNFRKISVPESMDSCIQRIDDLIINSVRKIWNKDREYGYGHTALLSGGLDSRVNVLLANELGYKPVHTYTFSQTGSSDEIIAHNIAEKKTFSHHFIPLDSGSYLHNDINTYIAANDGLVTYNAAAHQYSSIVPSVTNGNGIIHSGQIGDVLFGSYTLRRVNVHEQIIKQGYINEPRLIKPLNIYKTITARYAKNNNYELFSYEQRQINGTFNGDRMMLHHVETLSPFFDRQLVEFCYSLPDKFKYDQKIYLLWLNRCHPQIGDYPWSKTGIKPRNIYMNRATSFLKDLNRYAHRRLGINYSNMNPFDIWYQENPVLRKALFDEYEQNKNLISNARLNDAINYCIGKDRAQYIMNVVSVVLSADLYLNGLNNSSSYRKQSD
jgi:asparagine synthase (glutamine-hydrolysing)